MPRDKNTQELEFTFLEQSQEIYDLKENQSHLIYQLNESNTQKNSICRDLSRVNVSIYYSLNIFKAYLKLLNKKRQMLRFYS